MVSTKPLTPEEVRAIIDGRNKTTKPNTSKTAKDYSTYTFFAHGINKKCNSVEEALDTFGINWLVRTVDIRSYCPSEVQFDNIDFFEHKGVIRMDNGNPLATVGASIYTPLQNHECLEMFKEIVNSGQIVIDSGGVFDGGKRIWIATRLPEPIEIKFKDGEKQTILRYLHISWSHDQTQALTVSFMPYIQERKLSLACYVPSGVPCSISVKHTTNAKDRMNRGGVILNKALDFFRDAEEMLQKLASQTATPDRFRQMLSYLYPDSEDTEVDENGNTKKSTEEKTREKIYDRWQKLPASLQFTDFGAMLAISEYADFDSKSIVRGCNSMDAETKSNKQNEKKLDSSLFGTAQKTKLKGIKAIVNFDKIVKAGGISA